MSEQFAFVIERGDSEVSTPIYYAPQMADGWSQNHLDACRFARACDAESVADAYGLGDEFGIRICEHG